MTRREQTLLSLAFVLALLVLFYVYGYQPKQAAYQELTTKLVDKQEQLARMQTSVAQASRLEQEYKNLQGFIARMEARLPTGKDIPALLIALEELTRKTGVDLGAVRTGQLKPAGASPQQEAGGKKAPAQGELRYSTMPVEITLYGSYSQIGTFLRELRDFPRLIAISRITIAPRSVPTLAVSLSGETFVLEGGPGRVPTGTKSSQGAEGGQ
ncbi:MAG: type 4a pilus biogenesis protein PilO [Armatimonadota bacterium]|nr:type 4a pilus biogenesis protein PilO [Armatimonadota bacterium]